MYIVTVCLCNSLTIALDKLYKWLGDECFFTLMMMYACVLCAYVRMCARVWFVGCAWCVCVVGRGRATLLRKQ